MRVREIKDVEDISIDTSESTIVGPIKEEKAEIWSYSYMPTVLPALNFWNDY